MFALVDCNNFYASCERIFRPDLNNKPVVVLSNNDGCVIARSSEAKELGIPMAAPAFKYKQQLEENNVAVFSSNYALYGDMSHRVMNLLGTFAPEIEIYSIDEAFLKFGETYLNYEEYASMIQKYVSKSTGIPISVGFAPTKALAKVANKIAKKFSNRTKNAYVIDSEERRIKALKWLRIEDVWGIGRQHAKRLQKMGVGNAYAFTQLPDAWVRKNMTVVGLRLKHDLEGKPSLDLDDVADKKNIATTRTFDYACSDFATIEERVSTFATSCAVKLRKQNSCCNSLMVFVHTNGYRKDLPQYSKNIVLKLPFPTNSSIELSEFAVIGLRKIFKPDFKYKKAGIIVMDFTPESNRQSTLFEQANSRHVPLMKAMDQLNKMYGGHKIKLANQDLNRTWKMRQEKLSPRYTTNINEIIKVKA